MLMRRRTTGFTLIELLVVIAIIAVLAALSAGAFFRVRAAQQEKLTGEKIIQIQKVLLQQWSAVLDTARKEPIPDIVKAYAQNDPDRAKAIWAYLNLRKEFPESVAEARNPIILSGTALSISPQVVFPAQQVFLNNVPAAAASLTADQQASLCMYVALTKIERRGMQSGLTDTMTVRIGDQTLFADTFNTPLTFRRFFAAAELNGKPYVTNATTPNKDPLDPLGKLATLPPAYRVDIQAAIGGGRVLNNLNFMPTVVSYGLNKRLDVDGTGQPSGDDIYGHRLNVEGRTGD